MLRASFLITALSLTTAGAAFAQTGLDSVRSAPAGAPGVVNPTAAAPASGVAIGPNPDPYENLNRKSYALFRYLDRKAIRPASVFYAHAVPHVVRRGLHNAIQNVGEPVIFFNDVLQLHPQAAAQTLGRFAINSTVGVAGLGDPATSSGIPYHQNGFGTTMGRYGVPAGPYVFIPVLGPSDVRDLVGGGVDALSAPLTWIRYTGRWEVGAASTIVGGLDTRANADPQLKQIDSMATDPYATVRSLYLQNRQAQITGGQVNVNDLPDFGPEPVGDQPGRNRRRAGSRHRPCRRGRRPAQQGRANHRPAPSPAAVGHPAVAPTSFTPGSLRHGRHPPRHRRLRRGAAALA